MKNIIAIISAFFLAIATAFGIWFFGKKAGKEKERCAQQTENINIAEDVRTEEDKISSQSRQETIDEMRDNNLVEKDK